MKIVIDIPNAPINDYRDLYYKIHCMAASEGLFDDKVKSQRALALKVVLNVLEGVVEGTLLPKGHGRLIDADAFVDFLKNISKTQGYDEFIINKQLTGITVDDVFNVICESLQDENSALTIIEADKERGR